jgi:DNA-binding CsgD family transcriptional regulator
VSENEVIMRLRQVATRLTADADLRQDLMQEMHLHLLKAQAIDPGKPFEWYLKGCEFRARNYLELGRSIDSQKRSARAVAFGCSVGGGHAEGQEEHLVDTNKADLRVELMTAEIVQLVANRLTPRQQQTLDLLMKGCGVRETARRLGVSHPAIIKHRRKIAQLAAALLEQKKGPPSPARQFVDNSASYSGIPVTSGSFRTKRLPVRVTISKGTSI